MSDFVAWCSDDEDGPGGGRRIEASGAGEAAEKWVARYEQAGAEYDVASGRATKVVCVRPADHGGPTTTWEVGGDPHPSYVARAIR